MTVVYIILGIFALAVIYIAVMYAINSKKINKKKSKDDAKPAKSEKKPDKEKQEKPKTGGELEKQPEFKTEFVDFSPKDAAMQQSYEETKQKELAGMEDFSVPKKAIEDDEMTELERALFESGKKRRYGLEKSVIEQKHMRSETNKIGVEGPTKQSEQSSENNQSNNSNEDIDISKMNEDMKKILIADIINKKY